MQSPGQSPQPQHPGPAWQQPHHVQDHYGNQQYPQAPRQQWQLPPRPVPGRAPTLRWVAHPPYGAPDAPAHPQLERQWRQRQATLDAYRAGSEASPRYALHPRWGLPHALSPVAAQDVAREMVQQRDTQRVAARCRLLMRLALWLVVVAAVGAVIGWGRYGMLVGLRGHVVPVWVEWLSAGAVYAANGVAFAMVVAVLVVLASWLVGARRLHYAPRRDPRRASAVVALTIVPGLNVLYLPVLCRELYAPGQPQPRVRRRVRWAWALLAAAQLVAVVYWLQVWRPTAQFQANALSLGALMLALTAGSAWWLRRALRAMEVGEPLRHFVYAGPGRRARGEQQTVQPK